MLRSFLTIGALQFLTMLVLLVRTKSLALMLGPQYVGAMAVTDKLLALIMQPVALSFPFAALRFLPGEWHAGPQRYAMLLRRMVGILLVTSAIATVGAVLVTMFAPQLWGAQLLPYRGAVLWATVSLPVLVFVPFIQNAIAGRMREGGAMRFTLTHAMVFAFSAVVGAWWKGLVGVYMLYAGLGLLVVAWGLRRAFAGTADTAAAPTHSAPHDGPRGWLGLPPALWRFTAALMILTFISPFVALRVHYTVLSELGAETAGWMQAAIGLSLSVRALLGSAHPVFLTPNVNRGGAPADRLAWANGFQRTFCLLVIAMVPPLLLFSALAVRVLYSPAFSPGARFTVYFVVAEVITLIGGTYQSLILALDHMVYHVVQNVAAQLLMVITAIVLIPRLGIAGAGIATMSAPIFIYVTTLAFLHWRHGLRLPTDMSRLGIFTAGALAATGALGAVWPGMSLGVVAAKLGLYGLVLAVGAGFLAEDDRRRLLALLRVRRRAPEIAA